jgi:hypothetical protein
VGKKNLEQYVDRLVKTKYGTAGRLAAKIGMSLSAFSRGVNEEGTLSVENCLRLADEVGDKAAKILRLAGKPHVADVVERITGAGTETLSSKAHAVGYKWDTLNDPDLQDVIVKTLDAFWLKAKRGKRRRLSADPSAPAPARRNRSHAGASSLEQRL